MYSGGFGYFELALPAARYDDARRAAFQEEYGVPRAASSLDELLSDPEIEGVLVTTPNDSHKAVILESLDAGKAVYTDKPIAHTDPKPRYAAAAAAR